MLKFLKDWMLPLAMVAGTLTYPWISRLIFLTPYLIFAMLLLTFCKLSPRDIHIHKAHVWLLLIQLVGSVVVYGMLYSIHPVVAQGALICVLAPTATAAAVITGMLGGSVPFLTSYLLLCNIGVAIVAPALFPLIEPHSGVTFLSAFIYICKQVGPILILPLLLAWIIRRYTPVIHQKLLSLNGATFYIWAFSLTLVTGTTVNFLVEQEDPNYVVEISMAVVALVICVIQFLLGRRIGRTYGDPISSGQGLGQKNTILAIWMAQTYLNPISSVAPAAYVLWQNIINSYQLWLKGKRDRKTLNTTI
ncbi:transporter [Parabacteroides sp. PF5-6]|uniref:transporter n=1 Tax=Parabacteroides sp. PF5-6 TaxID=1742403 RepID=UPI002405BFEB|nr:transporter [Parabacteroides sp. PF5-6]MDF9828937.1 BASS family bile acid:Na+ symporter [Parabacteroides sp. PF5-6]